MKRMINISVYTIRVLQAGLIHTPGSIVANPTTRPPSIAPLKLP